ncbi:hypothetical protein YC2023_122394 [Brassica napus]
MSSYVLLANLRAGRCSNTAEVRLLRFWEARNDRKDGELMSLDMLLLDEQVNPIVFSALTLSGGGSVKAPSTLSVVSTWHGLTKNSDSLTLRCPYASMMGLSYSGFAAMNSFWHWQILTENSQVYLFYIVGEVRSTITDVRGPQRVMVTLRLEGEDNLRAALGRMGLSSRGMEGVIDQVRNKHYQLACTMTFEAVYGTSCDAGINHPNQYFEESRKILKSKTPLLRKAPGEATSADPVHFIDTCPRGRSFTFFLWESLKNSSFTGEFSFVGLLFLIWALVILLGFTVYLHGIAISAFLFPSSLLSHHLCNVVFLIEIDL